ncbi:unnamed protein product [Musa acuminata var. zebrina]
MVSDSASVGDGLILIQRSDGHPQNVNSPLGRSKCSYGPAEIKTVVGFTRSRILSGLQVLQTIVGAENPALVSAAEQIFGAGGKRLPPALVFLVSRATAQIFGVKELTVEHRRLAEIIEMIHTASLIHDDVLDDSGMPRVNASILGILLSTRVAVTAGDFMFAQSRENGSYKAHKYARQISLIIC